MKKSIDIYSCIAWSLSLSLVATLLLLPACGPGGLVRPLFDDDGRNRSILGSITGPAGLIPPSNLAGQAVSTTEIELIWIDDNNIETGYEIVRKDAASPDFVVVATLDANTEDYIDTGLSPEADYEYKVCAKGVEDDVDFLSDFTEPLAVSTWLLAPDTLLADSTSPTEVLLTWNDVSANEDGYEIERSANDDTNFETVTTVAGGSTQYLDMGEPDGLLPVTQYFYRIRAVNNSNNESEFANFPAVTTQGRNYIHFVPDNGLTLQETIDGATPGDTIMVRPDSVNGGPYKENIVIDGKAVTLKSFGGPSVTTLDGGRKSHVIRMTGSETSGCLIEGFTITNGVADNGGGIFCSDGSPTIRNNWIVDNKTTKEGGGIYLGNSSATVEFNRISDNLVQGTLLAKGGGIACNVSSAEIRGNTISSNTLGGAFYAHGAGVSLHGGGDPKLLRNIICENSIGSGLYTFGGAIDLNGTNGQIVTNYIANNATTGNGGAISCVSANPQISGNLLCKNSASAHGGGVYCSDASPVMTNNTMAYNSAVGQGGGVFCFFASSAPEITNCIIWGNTAGTGSGIHGGAPVVSYSNVQDFSGGTGNLNVDPSFIDVSSDNYHLMSGSLCINAGNNGATGIIGEDLDAETRLNGVVDMGMDEQYDYNTANGEYHVPVSYATIEDALAQAIVTKITVAPDYAHGGPNFANLDFGGKAVLLESQLGAKWTTIDGGQNGSVLVFQNLETATTVVDGFTITNGATTLQGGGVFCANASAPIIRNNIIVGNSAVQAGGGIGCADNADPDIHDNKIIGNVSELGGGVYFDTVLPDIAHNQFYGNHATTGGGMALDQSAAPVFNNLFAGNTCSENGAGVHLLDSDPILTNCTFYGNSAGLEGGGLFVDTDSTAVITNTIFWDNTASVDAQQISDVDSLADVTYSCIMGIDVWPGTGNIIEDPGFWGRASELGNVEANREYSLRQAPHQEYALSYCVDMGSDLAANLGLDTRTTSTGKDQDTGIVDMGFHYAISP